MTRYFRVAPWITHLSGPTRALIGAQLNPQIMRATYASRATVLLSFLAALQFSLLIGYFPFAIILTPYGDTLDWLGSFYGSSAQSLWQYLWTPHNGHRIVFSKLLTMADAKLLGGLSYPIALVCLSLLLIAAVIVLAGLRRHVQDVAARRWAMAVTVLLLFPASSFPNIAYPVNSQQIIVSFFAFVACVLLVRSGTSVEERKLGRNATFLLALAAGMCASLSSLNGLLVWPILLWLTWTLALRRSRRLVIVTAGALVIMGLAYHDIGSSEFVASAGGLGSIAHVAKYLVEFHGMPWVEIPAVYWPGMAVGVIVVSLSLGFCVKGVLAPPRQRPLAMIALPMLMFSFGTAIVITVGRHAMGLLPAHRYGIFLVITCVALLILGLPTFERWMLDRRGHVIVLSASLVFALGYLGQQVPVGQFAVRRAELFAGYEKQILAGTPGPQAVRAIYLPGAEPLERHYRVLKEQRIYMFRPE